MLTSEHAPRLPQQWEQLPFPKQPAHFQKALTERWSLLLGPLPWGCLYPFLPAPPVCGYTHIWLILISFDLN